MNKNRPWIGLIIAFVIVMTVFSPITAEQLHSPAWGYFLDLPEDFTLVEKEGTASYRFEHSMIPVTIAINSYPLSRYKSAKETMQTTYEKLGAEGDMENVRWRNNDCVIGRYTMNLGGQEYSGWGAAVALPEQKGITLILSYSPSEYFVQFEQVIVSVIDSLSIDRRSLHETGIITTYAYPKEGDKNIILAIDGESIPIIIDKSDVAANTFVVEREYAILTLFADTPMWQEAWQRYYRMIYRDAYKRLARTSFALYNALYHKTEQEYPANPDRALAQKLLVWTQGMEYVRQPLGTDFTPLPAILDGAGSDCDSRALLLAVLMSHMNYETMLFVSQEYSHAFFGINVEGPGARLEKTGISYLLGETTAPVDIGSIPQSMSDSTKWMGISGL